MKNRFEESSVKVKWSCTTIRFCLYNSPRRGRYLSPPGRGREVTDFLTPPIVMVRCVGVFTTYDCRPQSFIFNRGTLRGSNPFLIVIVIIVSIIPIIIISITHGP